MSLATESEVIAEGYQAYLENNHKNPYLVGTWAREAWSRGYAEAYRKFNKKRQ